MKMSYMLLNSSRWIFPSCSSCKLRKIPRMYSLHLTRECLDMVKCIASCCAQKTANVLWLRTASRQHSGNPASRAGRTSAANSRLPPHKTAKMSLSVCAALARAKPSCLINHRGPAYSFLNHRSASHPNSTLLFLSLTVF